MPIKKTSKKAVKKTNKKIAKKAVKKTSRVSKSKSKRALISVAGQKCFWTTDGKILHDLNELAEAFTSMTENVYAYHVTTEKNDFADWVETVLKDAECSVALRKAKKPNTARTTVVRYLKLYKI